MKNLFADLAANLRHGVRAMLLMRVALGEFRIAPDQVVALALLSLATQCAVDIAFNGLDGYLNVPALTAELTVIVGLLFAAFVMAKLTGEPRILAAYPVALLAMDPYFLALQAALRWGTAVAEGLPVREIYLALLAWYLIAAFLLLVKFAPGRPARAGAGFAVYLVLFFTSYWGLTAQDLWVARPAAARAERQPSVADEANFYAQPALLEASLSALRPQRPGVPDIYFVGFAGFAPEDVFMKEVEAIGDLLRERFDAEGRTIALVNNPATVDTLPIASATTLARVLRHVGGLMNRDEDVLVLYLTSHGSESHRLAVVNRPLSLLEIDPKMLRRMLDDAGIRWRVIAVSACYAGGFIEDLKGDGTLIMTAADANRQSFGCGAESDFTYFGKALFDVELRRTHSFLEAFSRARGSIAERELAEKYDPSNPQLYAGAGVQAKLREVEARLRTLPAPATADEDR